MISTLEPLINLPALKSHLLATNKELHSRLNEFEWEDLLKTIIEFVDIRGYSHEIDMSYENGVDDGYASGMEDGRSEGVLDGREKILGELRDFIDHA